MEIVFFDHFLNGAEKELFDIEYFIFLTDFEIKNFFISWNFVWRNKVVSIFRFQFSYSENWLAYQCFLLLRNIVWTWRSMLKLYSIEIIAVKQFWEISTKLMNQNNYLGITR